MITIIIILILLGLFLKLRKPLRQWWVSNTIGWSPFYTFWYFGSIGETFKTLVEKYNIRSGFHNAWLGHVFLMNAVDPDSAQFVLKNPNIVKAAGIRIPSIKETFGKNLVFVNGEDWRRHRHIVNNAFNHESFKSYFPIFLEVGEKCLQKLSQIQGDFDCVSWYPRFTLDLLGKSIFHYDFHNLDKLDNEYYEAYKTVFSGGGSFNTFLMINFPFLASLPLPGSIKLKQATAKLLELFNTIIEEKKKEKTVKGDILDRLLEALEKDKSLSSVEVISDIFVFFVAGHETTSTALGWATAELAARQDIQEKLYQEITEQYGDQPPSLETIYNCLPPYLEWFILENLRVHPPIPEILTRIATADIPYKDQVIPKDARVSIGIERIHNHPHHWEKPEEFNPLRFTPENRKGRNKFAYLPFSLGARQCIGNEFSEIEQRLFLVRLLQKFKILPPKNLPPKDLKKIIGLSRPHIVNISLQPRK